MMRAVAVAAGVGFVVIAALVAIGVVLGADDGTSWVDLEPGDCFDLAAALGETDADTGGLLLDVDPLDCTRPHDAEVVAVGRLDPSGDAVYPADDVLFGLVDDRCSLAVGDRIDRSRYGLLPIAPDERTWDDRQGRFACVAVVAGGGVVATSAFD